MPRLLPPLKNLKSGIKEAPLDMTTNYRPGWFGYMEDAPVIEWTHCRDIFQAISSSSLKKNGMWYCYTKNCGENICAFIDRVESTIGIKERTFFSKTNEYNIIWLQPSPFWVNDFIRRSFFTLALRCGVYYKRSRDNFMDVFNKRAICRGTMPAIKRFLAGYTFYPFDNPEYNVHGWQYTFYDKYGAELESMLIRK